MAKVQNNSNISITRIRGNSVDVLGNEIFNGYVYNLSLTVGFNGEPSSLILNLALNKTLKKVETRKSIIGQRKTDIERKDGQVQNTTSFLTDLDFQINETYIGINTSYDIVIQGPNLEQSYQLFNFKITSFSISKKNNDKILTLTLSDNSIVLNKIFVGLLGEHVALDSRSERDSVVDKIVMYCAAVNYTAAGIKTAYNIKEPLHFAEAQLAKDLSDKNAATSSVSSGSADGFNYITIQSNKPKNSIINGYGAVIILGEEEFKDSPCSSSEATYSFDTLLAAMKKLGIVIALTKSGEPSLKDKSKGKIKKNFSGTLKNVLNQWCDEYSYSYVVDFAIKSKVTIIGIDLSSSVSKEAVLQTRYDLENLELFSSDPGFVIVSQDLDYDLSQKKLKLYSSYYFKEARDKSNSYEQIIGNTSLYSMSLLELFPQWFTDSGPRDFCGASRNYNQVITSAVLGKFSPKLRLIYNYSIGALRALGFLLLSDKDINSKLSINDDKELLLEEAICTVLEIQSENLYDELTEGSPPMYDFHFGFYNSELVSQIERIESYIADFLGKHFWSPAIGVFEGSSANESSYNKFEVISVPATQKFYNDQIYSLPVIKDARFLTARLSALFDDQKTYFDAFSKMNEAEGDAKKACTLADRYYKEGIDDRETIKNLTFYTERTSATYGVFEELIRELEVLEYTLGDSTELNTMRLVEIFAPTFKELSPVTIGLLQCVLPLNISKLTLGDFQFGLLASITKAYQIYSIQPIANAVFVNPIELQNQIRHLCETISKILDQEISIEKGRKKNACSKTILYQVCVLPSEKDKIVVDNAATTQAAAGPDPTSCRRVKITRILPMPSMVFANIVKVSKTAAGGAMLIDPSDVAVKIQSLRLNGDYKVLYGVPTDKNYRYPVWESITLPSESSYPLTLSSKTTAEVFLPFEQYIKGGLESSDDIRKILENDAFSIDIFTNNITPNIRELFGEESSPHYIQSTTSDILPTDPVIMNYQGYIDTNPAYEFKTFSQFHEALKLYYNERSTSIQEPAVSFSTELFCSLISSGLKNILSLNNGLTSLNITLGEGGLNLKCQFSSRPVKEAKIETLIYKNKPNIKFKNTNFLA